MTESAGFPIPIIFRPQEFQTMSCGDRRSLTFLGHSVGQLLQIRTDEIRSRFRRFAAVLSAIKLLGKSHEHRALNAARCMTALSKAFNAGQASLA